MQDFKDKVAVITGAASGIGRGMAETFIAAGMKEVLSDVETQALQETTRSLLDAGADVHAVPADVSKPDQLDNLARQTLSKYGAVHVLCNNAGIVVAGTSTWTSSLDDWHWIVGVNLMGVVHGLRSFLPIMIEQDTDAHIVNTASLGGSSPAPAPRCTARRNSQWSVFPKTCTSNSNAAASNRRYRYCAPARSTPIPSTPAAINQPNPRTHRHRGPRRPPMRFANAPRKH